MKNFFTLIILGALVFCAFSFYTKTESEKFALTGTVEVPERLIKYAHSKNMTCSLIVKNEADVPIAIKRIINPEFPLTFKVDSKDLLVGNPEGPVKLEVQINSHGNLGILKAGDMFGSAEGLFEPNSKDIIVKADKMTGTPKMTSQRGNFFRTAAR
ncbi:hypothetical protein Dip510_000730 [Elusimicrobium posterum]|uniref:hypothetical protein n=1 Tax=Elusimicrobium posterum TaxID=3116653 RepID=UPI003C708D23